MGQRRCVRVALDQRDLKGFVVATKLYQCRQQQLQWVWFVKRDDGVMSMARATASDDDEAHADSNAVVGVDVLQRKRHD